MSSAIPWQIKLPRNMTYVVVVLSQPLLVDTGHTLIRPEDDLVVVVVYVLSQPLWLARAIPWFDKVPTLMLVILIWGFFV